MTMPSMSWCGSRSTIPSPSPRNVQDAQDGGTERHAVGLTAQGRKLQSMIPGAVLDTVPRSGHLMQEDAPEAILAAIHKLAQP